MDILRIEALADEAKGLADLVDALSVALTQSEGYDEGMRYLSALMYKYAENMERVKEHVFAEVRKGESA